MVKRVLLLATTTGYQTRAFGDAADRLGVELVFATDRCRVLEDPWRDRAVAIRFHDEAGSVATILDAAGPLDGVLAVGDRPVVIAARVLEALRLPGHPPHAAAVSRHKRLMRQRFSAAGLLVPDFREVPIDADPDTLTPPAAFPVVVKPVGLSASRGVIRADDPAALASAFRRVQAILRSPEVRAERSGLDGTALIETFVPGREYALEGLLHQGRLQTLALFDKPDPLDGPFFEETLYVTPSTADARVQQAISEAIASAASTMGLRHGPIHAECRVNDRGVFVLEVAARPIGGLCARALRFLDEDGAPDREASLEELLLRHALGESVTKWRRTADASGVLMIPIPARGLLRQVGGVEEARRVAGVTDVRITAKLGHPLVPLPEGATYLGFIFARGGTPAAVERALREAHGHLRFAIDPPVPVIESRNG